MSHPPIVVGAGLAGLTSAVALARAGLKPIVLEAQGQIGGRIRTLHTKHGAISRYLSFFLGEHTHCQRLLQWLDLTYDDLFLSRPFELHTYLKNQAKINMQAMKLPASLGILKSCTTAGGLSWAEKAKLIQCFKTIPDSLTTLDTDIQVLELLHMCEPSCKTIHQLWSPLCQAITHCELEEASARVFLFALYHACFQQPSKPFEYSITKPLFEQHLLQAASHYIRQQGGLIHHHAHLDELLIRDDRVVGVETSFGTFMSEQVILALPPQALSECLASHEVLKELTTPLSKLRFVDALHVHLSYQEPTSLPHAWLACLDSPVQRIFDAGPLGQPNTLIATLDAHAVHDSTTEDCVATTDQAIQGLIGKRTLEHSVINHQMQVALAGSVGVADHPMQPTCDVHGLFFAGEHLLPFYPSGLESMVASGLQSAQHLIQLRGESRKKNENNTLSPAQIS